MGISYGYLKNLYLRSPLFIQKLYSKVPFKYRMGKTYRQTCSLIEETDMLSWQDLEKLQSRYLRNLIEHAYNNVPYYKEAMRRLGITPSDIKNTSDLQMLPLLDKRIMQEEEEKMISVASVKEGCFRANTGGSTGTSFGFYINNSAYPKEQAYLTSQWGRVGYKPGNPKITLRGRVIDDSDKHWLYNPIYNELVLSSYHLDTESMFQYLDIIKHFKPEFIHGYPSAIVLLLQFLQENNIKEIPKIKAVLCGSEPVYNYQRNLIEDVLDTRVYSWYGLSEWVILGGECEYSHSYHMFPLYGIVELVDQKGNIIEQPNQEGEIIATGFHNTITPFIRYRTGDIGIYDNFDRCECGRAYRRLKKVHGRKQDYIITKTGKKVPLTAFIFGQHFHAFENIYKMQIVQKEVGSIVVRIVKKTEYKTLDEKELKDKMLKSVDSDLTVDFSYVDEVEKTQSGKELFLIQKKDSGNKTQ